MDLWGGFRNGITQAAWEKDTLVTVFSTTKGIASLAVAVAASRGLLSYDAKVADYWPEFAQGGKDAITVRQLLSHQAGLPFVSPPLTLQDLSNPTTMSPKLAAQRPAWTPGTRHGYHAITLGWYEGELIRRTDPEGRSLGQFFAEEVAKPLGLDFYIGCLFRWTATVWRTYIYRLRPRRCCTFMCCRHALRWHRSTRSA